MNLRNNLFIVLIFLLAGLTFNCKTEQDAPVFYTVTFNSNGGSLIAAQKVEKGKIIIEPDAPKLDNYFFEGWYLEETLYDFSTPVEKNIVLTARWIRVINTNSEKVSVDIAGLSSSACIKLTGTITSSTISTIASSLKTLSKTRSDIFLTIDLSETTGLYSPGYYTGCTNLSGIILPDTITSIGERAFSGCTSLKKIIIPDSVTSIGNAAFESCKSLTEMTLPSTFGHFYEKFGTEPFVGAVTIQASSSKNYYVPGTLKKINVRSNDFDFRYCKSLTTIILSEGITRIDGHAFYGCTNLTSINIPETVTYIYGAAFYGCTNLTSINIPEAVTCIDSSAFYGCTNLTSIIIPEAVTSIGNSAFEGCTSLTNINIPEAVTKIYNSTFSGCTSLEEITIPKNVSFIYTKAFYKCTSLKRVSFSDTTDWYFTKKGEFTDGTLIDSATLKNTTTAGLYLTETYSDKYWYKL